MAGNLKWDGVKVTAQLGGLSTLKQKFRELDSKTKKACRNAMQYIGLEVMNEAKRNTPVDMGQLRAQTTAFFTNYGLIVEVGSICGYSAFVEFGTGPMGRQTFVGDKPSNYRWGAHGGFPPLQVIRDWCKRHGIDEDAAFPIARMIRENGMKARPFLNPAYQLHKDDVMKAYKTIFRTGP